MLYEFIKYLELELEESHIAVFLRVMRQAELLGKLKALSYYYVVLGHPRVNDQVAKELLYTMRSHIYNVLYELAEIEGLESPDLPAIDKLIDELSKAKKQPQAQVVEAQ